MIFSRSLFTALGLTVAMSVCSQEAPTTHACHEPSCPVAKRGTAVVTVGDVMAKLMGLEPRKQDALLSDPKQLNAMLENLLITRQIANDLDQAKVAADPALQARLKQATDDVLAVYRLDEIRAERITSNFERLAKEYYLANKVDMHTPTIATVRHLLITPEKRGEVLARAQIVQLSEELKNANPSVFAEKVLELSEDPSKTSNAGIIKVVEGNTDIAEEFSDAALAIANVGEVVGPIQTKFGYHLLQLVSKLDATTLTFEQAKPRIIEKLQQDARRRVVGDYRGELMASGQLEAFPDNLAGLIFGEESEATEGAAGEGDK